MLKHTASGDPISTGAPADPVILARTRTPHAARRNMLTSPQRPLGFAPQGQMSASAASPAPGPLLPPAPPPRCQVLATGRPGSGSSSGLNGSSLRRAGARVAARAAEAAAAAAADLQQGQLAVPEVALLTEGAELLQGVRWVRVCGWEVVNTSPTGVWVGGWGRGRWRC